MDLQLGKSNCTPKTTVSAAELCLGFCALSLAAEPAQKTGVNAAFQPPIHGMPTLLNERTSSATATTFFRMTLPSTKRPLKTRVAVAEVGGWRAVS
jgi:hypothetical protein